MKDLRRVLPLLALFAAFTLLVAGAEETKPDAGKLVKEIFQADKAKVYEAAHKLAELPAEEIAFGLSEVPEKPEPSRVVALLSVLLPKRLLNDLPAYTAMVMDSGDEQAMLDLLDLFSYAVPPERSFSVFNVVRKYAGKDLPPVVAIRLYRTMWTMLAFTPGIGNLLERTNFELATSLQQIMWMAVNNPQNDEMLRCEAAVTLGEMGVDNEKVTALIKRVANDPTPLGRRARSVLLGHPIYDEVVRRAQMYHVDVDKLKSVRLAIQAAKGVASSLDKHSTFFDPEEVKSWRESRTGEYGGIGAYVSVRDGGFVISRPFYNGPAYKAGLRSGDRIVEVDGVVLRGTDLNDLVKRLKGKPGTKVRVKIFRRGWTKPREFVLERAKITVPNIHWCKLPGEVGYIRLDSFSEKAVSQMIKALSEVKTWNPRGIVFDLRNNPGGGLSAAVDIASMFLDGNKLIVYEEGRPGIWARQNHFVNRNIGVKYSGPVVILVNGYTASAAEIVSGSLKDYGRVTLVGTKTYGKGSVQVVFWIADSNYTCQFKVTIAKYFLPNHECIHGKGIEPQVKVEPLDVQGWVFDEAARLREEGILKKYIDELTAKDEKLAMQLAENDYGDPGRYPGFDEWRKGFRTILDREMLRYVLNEELRRVMQDKLGREFPCNPGSDVQLQRAILEVLKSAGIEPASVPDAVPFVELERKRQAKAAEEERKRKAMLGE